MSNDIDPRTMLQILRKQPGTNKQLNMDFVNLLGTATVSSVTSVARTTQGLVTEVVDLTFGTPSNDTTKAQVEGIGGTDGEDYIVTVKVVNSNGDTLEGDGVLQVRENVQ